MVQKRGNLKHKWSEEFPLDRFRSLLGVMSIQEARQRAKELRQAKSAPVASGTSSTTDLLLPNAAKRTRAARTSESPVAEPKTPDQPTHPSNPNLTGGTDESKDEENTKELLKELLMDSMSVLELDFPLQLHLALWRSCRWYVCRCAPDSPTSTIPLNAAPSSEHLT